MPKVTKKNGFTLHELLVTVVVIAVISAIGFAVSVNVPKRIRDSHRKTDINNIKLSLEAFYEKNNKYPPLGAAYSSQTIFVSDTIPAGASAWIPEVVPNFTKNLPKDPKQTAQNLFNLARNFLNKFTHNYPPPVYADTSGPNDPDLGADNTSIGTVVWGNPSNILSSNDLYAAATVRNNASHYLVATDFDFAIPSGATIDGIEVRVELQSTGSPSNVIDNAVRIVKGGSIGTTDKSSPTRWSFGTDAERTYGSSSDKWSETWTAADINSTNFGFAISAKETNNSQSNAQVDHIQITVHYTPVAQAPTVTTSAATSIGENSATLNGSANPNGQTTTGWFRYSTTNPGSCNDTFGTRAPTSGGTNLGSGSSAVAYNEPISGLSSDTTYYFCAIASNSVGTSFGAILSFTTLTPGPSPTPTPTPSPDFVYVYYVSSDRTTYSVWAQLENTKDPAVNTNPGARCKDTPPAGYEFMNYCGDF